MRFERHDGGRAAAGFKGDAPGGCVCRSIAIATRLPYREVYDGLNGLAWRERPRGWRRSHAKHGVFRVTYERYLRGLGWEFTPTMSIGSGCRVHLRDGELPAEGALVVRLSNHLTAVVDGVIFDLYDPSRGGTRCVYGYYRKIHP